MLPEFHSIFSTYNVSPGRQVCMKYFKSGKDNVAASTSTIKYSVATAHDLVDKSLVLFDCSPLKNVKPDRTLQTGKRKISNVKNVFSTVVTVAHDGPAFGQRTNCLNCCQFFVFF